MYFFRSIFLISILCNFINFTYSNSNLADIREKGSSSNSLTVNATNNTSLSTNYTQDKLFSVSHQNGSFSLMQVASEGGGIISSTTGAHIGRENTLEHPLTKTVINQPNATNTKPQNIKPVKASVISSVDLAPPQDDEKPSVPKKGVNFHHLDSLDSQLNLSSNNSTNKVQLNISNPTNSTNNVLKKVSNHTSSGTATVIHKKPVLTESDADFQNLIVASKETPEAISIEQIDPLIIDKTSNRSDYIVPIVAVILSVPLVAIFASILYKRGTDWWQHRNYKRMDFLIEGMYHN